MADGGSIGKAYVQIVPTTKGIGKALGEELGGAGDKAGKAAGEKAGGGFAGMLRKAIAAAGVGMIIKSAFDEGAKLQQSIGGIETLFGAGGAKSAQEYADSVGKSVDEVRGKYESLKQSEATMLQYANDAWKTAGLSANEYMETSTSFAASLLTSLDGDTNKAAEAANRAVIAMSDNANKMGTDMASIQNAYMGFAKQNYMMLDNLKLGYGGTKSEMERLLKDAEQLSGVHYDIDNLADVYSAVSVIQDKLGITGTTAKEASTTFSGAFASMKAAATNVLGALTTGGNVGAALTGLGEAAKTFVVGNLIPMLQNLISAVPGLLKEGVGMAAEIFGALMNALPEMAAGLMQILPSLMEGLTAALPGLLSTFTAMVPQLIESITGQLPLFFTAAAGLLQALANGILNNLPLLLQTALPLLMNLAQGLIENAGQLIMTGLQLILALVQGLIGALPTLISFVPQIIYTVVNALIPYLPQIIEAGIQILFALINGVTSLMPQLIPLVFQIIGMIFQAVINNLPQIIQGGVQILAALIRGILQRIGTLLIAGKSLITTLMNALADAPRRMLEVGRNVVRGIWQGISSSFTWIKNQISGWVGNVVSFIKNLFNIGSPSKLMADEVGAMLPAGIAVGVEARTDLVTNAMRELTDGAVSAALIPEFGSRTGAAAAGGDGGNAQLREIILLLIEFIRLYKARGADDPGADRLIAYIDQELGRLSAKRERGVL